MVQYYGVRGRLPRQILLPEHLDNQEDMGRFLSERGERKTELVTPQRGAKVELIRMAQENAREECQRVTTKEERTAKILTLLAEKLELSGPPRRIEAYDISMKSFCNCSAPLNSYILSGSVITLPQKLP